MNFKEKWRTCLEARKAFKKARKAKRKLYRRKDAGQKQKNSWKATRAKAMRLNPTKCEAILFDALHEAQILFEPQVQIGPYIADCLIPLKRVVVEVDGPVHDSRKDYDLARDRYMWNARYRVIRFTNAEVEKNTQGVMSRLRTFIAEVK